MRDSAVEHHIYDGDIDQLVDFEHVEERIMLVPDTKATDRGVDPTPRIRIMWGQRLLDDLQAGRYRSLVCAVNAEDNSHGIIAQLADLLPTSQWNTETITSHAKHFVQARTITVVKYDMDAVEVFALLRPAEHEHLDLNDIAQGFQMITAMMHRRCERQPIASVSFLGANANRLLLEDGSEPSFESVLNTMYTAGFRGDVYTSPFMWSACRTGVFARYPFPESISRFREGGF